MNLFIANDHAATDLKLELLRELKLHYPEILIKNLGTNDSNSCHYPDYARMLCRELLQGESITPDNNRGILLCGSGIGISIMANRFKGIRAALCTNKEMATLSRQHNNANVLCLGARFIKLDEALSIIKVWLETDFEGGRHLQRIQLLDQL